MVSLPDEMVELVFERVSPYTLWTGTCAAVCRQWYRVSKRFKNRAHRGRWEAYRRGWLKPKPLLMSYNRELRATVPINHIRIDSVAMEGDSLYVVVQTTYRSLTLREWSIPEEKYLRKPSITVQQGFFAVVNGYICVLCTRNWQTVMKIYDGDGRRVGESPVQEIKDVDKMVSSAGELFVLVARDVYLLDLKTLAPIDKTRVAYAVRDLIPDKRGGVRAVGKFSCTWWRPSTKTVARRKLCYCDSFLIHPETDVGFRDNGLGVHIYS